MKIISIELGRVTQNYVAEEVRPLSGINLPEFSRLVQERYGFAKAPTPAEMVQAGARFQTGRLQSGTKTINIAELAIFSDGVSASSYHTDDAEFLLEDAINWSRRTFGVREPTTKKSRVYESHVIIEFEKSIDSALSRFDQFRTQMAEAIEDTYGVKVPILNQRLDFSGPTNPLPDIGRPFLVIERRVGYAAETNRFFSSATVRTDTHLELLAQLEKSLP